MREKSPGRNHEWVSRLGDAIRIHVIGFDDDLYFRCRAPINDAPLTAEVALATRHVDLGRHDPADRFLAATAKVFNLTLVTADQHLLQGRGFQALGPKGSRNPS